MEVNGIIRPIIIKHLFSLNLKNMIKDTWVRDKFSMKRVPTALFFHIHRQCLWFVLKEAVCCKGRTQVHDKVVYRAVSWVNKVLPMGLLNKSAQLQMLFLFYFWFSWESLRIDILSYLATESHVHTHLLHLHILVLLTYYFATHNANIIWENNTIHIIMYLYLLFFPII